MIVKGLIELAHIPVNRAHLLGLGACGGAQGAVEELLVAEPVPMPLAVYMADKGDLWAEMTRKYDLRSIPYEQVVAWRFGDFIFNSGFDNITSTIKARRL